MAVELRKGERVNLVKRPAGVGQIVINLNWDRPRPRIPLLGRDVDLDLGCLFQMQDGWKGAVQALGGEFGRLDRPPYIALDGDDRTGEAAGGENLRIDGGHIALIRRVLVYAFIYEGVTNWKRANGVATLRYPGNEDLIVRLDEYDNARRVCAIALLENRGGESFSVEKQMRFFPDHAHMDAAYGWGMRWKRDRK